MSDQKCSDKKSDRMPGIQKRPNLKYYFEAMN